MFPRAIPGIAPKTGTTKVMDESLTDRWRPKSLLACVIAAALLFGSWIFPPTRALWDVLDREVFWALNATLAEPGGWQAFWAIANWRPFDIIAQVAIVALSIYWVRRVTGRQAKLRIVVLAGFALLMLLMSLATQRAGDIVSYQRSSPTREFMDEDPVRLSQEVTWLKPKPKDRSKQSFPGDHAFVLISLVAFFWTVQGRRFGLVAMVCLLPFAVPRVVSGAHWLTDILVGAGCMALLMWGAWFCVPVHAGSCRWCARKADKPLGLLTRLFRVRGEADDAKTLTPD